MTARAFIEGPAVLDALVLKTTLLVLAAVGALCLAVFVLGDLPVVLFFGKKFAGSGPVLFVLALSLLSSALGLAPMFGLLAMERPQFNFLAGLGAVGISLTLGVYLVKSFGLVGAAYGALFSNVALSGVRWMAYPILIRAQMARQVP